MLLDLKGCIYNASMVITPPPPGGHVPQPLTSPRYLSSITFCNVTSRGAEDRLQCTHQLFNRCRNHLLNSW